METSLTQSRLKQLIWLYFWLLIFEGALRRWILPSLSAPLLLIREPIAIAILVLGLQAGLLRRLPLLMTGSAVTVMSLLLTMLFAHRNLVVALYGARIMLLHFPLIFVIARVFQLPDVLRMGRACAFLAIPMTSLIAAQFLLPQSHLVNIGIGGEGTAGFGSNTDRFRPPGTFSFTLGVTQFYSLVGAFIIAFGTLRGFTRKWWWIAATIATSVAVPLSISRGLFFQLLVTAVVLVAAGGLNARLAPRIVLGCAAIAISVWAATFIPTFDTAVAAFIQRFASASDSEGGFEGVFVDRFLGGLWSALANAHTLPIAGLGLGLGTNAGAQISTGERAFLVAEGEWLRIVGEMGPLLGLALIGIRVSLAVGILQHAFRSWRAANPVPLLLGSVAALWVAQGNWAQPTALGFSVLAGGLALAANRRPQAMPAQARPRTPEADGAQTRDPHRGS